MPKQAIYLSICLNVISTAFILTMFMISILNFHFTVSDIVCYILAFSINTFGAITVYNGYQRLKSQERKNI